jgi:hypothetical protein
MMDKTELGRLIDEFGRRIGRKFTLETYNEIEFMFDKLYQKGYDDGFDSGTQAGNSDVYGAGYVAATKTLKKKPKKG